MHCLSSLSVIFVQVPVENKHIFMENMAACSDKHPFQLLLWEFELRESPTLAQHKLCIVLRDVNRFSM